MMECVACSRQFGGIVAFDAHQRWDYGKPHGQQLTCLDPGSIVRADGTLAWRVGSRGQWVDGREFKHPGARA